MIIVNGRFLSQPTTGVQRYAMEMSLALKSIRPDIRIVSPPDIVHKDLAQRLSVEVVGKGAGHRWEQVDLARHLRRTPAALLVNLANMAPLGVARQIVVIHDLAFFANPKWFGVRFRLYYRYAIPRLARRAFRVITVSEFSKRELCSRLNLPDDKVAVVGGGVSELFSVRKAPEAASRQTKYVLAVSSLDPRKNLEGVVRAFARLDRNDLQLIIAGTDHRAFAPGDWLALADKDARIRFVGHVTDEQLAELYRGAAAFVYPSLYEGFGLPPLEAMASGCPCLLSDRTALPEVFGDAALYCNPEEEMHVASQLERLLVDPDLRNSLIQRGLRLAQQRTWNHAAMGLIKIAEEYA
jgi:glycosyltransferase involved in cell wall biosynthesis